MSGQYRKGPFHVNRDVVRDNLTVVRKLRLPKGAEIRARKMYATADTTSANATVNMPYTGNLYLTVVGGGNDVLVNNPFVTSTTPLVADGAATVAYTSPGLFTVTNPPVGTIVVSAGVQTDAHNNGYAQ